MPNDTNEENWAARERLRRVEFLIWWRGWVGRQDLMGAFGISSAQASGDLQRYARLNPSAMIYHTSRKRYESSEGMTCILHIPSFEEAVSFFLGRGHLFGSVSGAESPDPRLSVIGLPKRSLNLSIARRILMALLEKRSITVKYNSVKSGASDPRSLSPGGLGWDGGRWHVRAWCGKRMEWRDFVLGRFIEASWPGKSAEGLPEDHDWMTFETVKLQVNPNLRPEQREGLRIDYGLPGDELEIRVRRAMKQYLLAAMLIDHASLHELPRHFLLETPT